MYHLNQIQPLLRATRVDVTIIKSCVVDLKHWPVVLKKKWAISNHVRLRTQHLFLKNHLPKVRAWDGQENIPYSFIKNQVLSSFWVSYLLRLTSLLINPQQPIVAHVLLASTFAQHKPLLSLICWMQGNVLLT